MTPQAALLMMSTAAAAVAYIVHVIASSILKHKEMDARSEQLSTPVSDERMARLENAVESIALEVERISEGQRFTTKLLHDAAHKMPQRIEQTYKHDTPH